MSANNPELESYLQSLQQPFLVSEATPLDCHFSAHDLQQENLSVGKPQIRAVLHANGMVVVDVLVMVNALARQLQGSALKLANQPVVELSYRIADPQGETAMSVSLWELTYSFENFPGGQYFDFAFTAEQ